MKNVLLFVVIMTVCGSLMKAPVSKECNVKIEARYFTNGKLVNKRKYPGRCTFYGIVQPIFMSELNKTVIADSMVLELKNDTP